MSHTQVKREENDSEWQSEREREIEERGYRSKLIPLVIQHGPTLPVDHSDQRWLTKEQRAPPWLDLLYDLVIVAILTVFSVNHEITEGEAALNYFSYFVIIWWIWASQVLYDVRFEANDWMHRFFKFCQLGCFAFVGVTAQYFNPTDVVWPTTVSGDDTGARVLGAASWTGVAASYAAGRLFLIFQYLAVIWTTRRHKRHLASMIVPAVSAFLSAILWGISAGIAGPASVKVALGYTGLAIEVVTTFMLPFSSDYMKTPSDLICERFGALSIIIIGEGIIGIVRSFSAVMSGFGFSRPAYAQCFCALVIISALWHFLFHGFNVEVRMGRKRGLLWLILHFPLHFCIILLLTGLRNASSFANINHALNVVGDNVQAVYEGIAAGNLTTTNNPSVDYLTVQFEKLGIYPSWPDQIEQIEHEAYDPDNKIDPVVDLIQYEAQIYVYLAQYYDVHLSPEVLNLASQIQSLNTTLDNNNATVNQTYERNYDLVVEFDMAYKTDLGHGTLFFLPSSGAVLFLISILRLLRSMPLGRWMWASWIVQIAGSLGLGFLGFLDLGDTTISDDVLILPAYRLLGAYWMLPTTALTYALLILIDSLLMLVAARHDRQVPMMPRAEEHAAIPSRRNTSISVEPHSVPYDSPGDGSSKAVDASHDSETMGRPPSVYPA